ncbi:IS200/IS605 family transposase [Kitasatospora sp. DSM 101779]|uniref:IS200/IS605 family transposase n=1 Tax=Kitasatospora sp. DSM 101779 TaxID=2853165 RepID=UPI0021D8D7A6|nr:IS200/IS605 family transposase [Kitasatospora sp. DSM 101779]MCU7827091.1 IS200/IS605 family transposase [Kitasatospora sp. DSM 101779]
MRVVCVDLETEPVEFNGERDHVHLLVHHPPKAAISRLVGSLKGVSARRLRQEFPGHLRPYLWGEHFRSPSYFAASCGRAPLEITREVHREPEGDRTDRRPARRRAFRHSRPGAASALPWAGGRRHTPNHSVRAVNRHATTWASPPARLPGMAAPARGGTSRWPAPNPGG